MAGPVNHFLEFRTHEYALQGQFSNSPSAQMKLKVGDVTTKQAVQKTLNGEPNEEVLCDP